MTPTKPNPPPAYVPDEQWSAYLDQKAAYERMLCRRDAIGTFGYYVAVGALVTFALFVLVFPTGIAFGWW